MTRIDLSIGDVRIAIDNNGDGPGISVPGASQRFVTSLPASADMFLRVGWGRTSAISSGRLLFDSGGVWTLHEEGGWRVYRLTSPVFGPEPYKEARVSWDLSNGDVVFRRDAFHGVTALYPLEYPLDEILVTHRLANDGGVVLHGCGMVGPDGLGLFFSDNPARARPPRHDSGSVRPASGS